MENQTSDPKAVFKALEHQHHRTGTLDKIQNVVLEEEKVEIGIENRRNRSRSKSRFKRFSKLFFHFFTQF